MKSLDAGVEQVARALLRRVVATGFVRLNGVVLVYEPATSKLLFDFAIDGLVDGGMSEELARRHVEDDIARAKDEGSRALRASWTLADEVVDSLQRLGAAGNLSTILAPPPTGHVWLVLLEPAQENRIDAWFTTLPVDDRAHGVSPPTPSLDGRVASATSRRSSVNRNDPCPCGSGKKYKRCCLS